MLDNVELFCQHKPTREVGGGFPCPDFTWLLDTFIGDMD